MLFGVCFTSIPSEWCLSLRRSVINNFDGANHKINMNGKFQ